VFSTFHSNNALGVVRLLSQRTLLVICLLVVSVVALADILLSASAQSVLQATTTTTAIAPQPIDLTSLSALLSVAISGAVAIGSLYLTYRSRSQPHREFLYEKQIEAYEVLANAIIRLTQPLYDFIGSHNYKLTSKSQGKMARLYNKLFQDNFSPIESRLWGIMPIEVMEPISNLTATIEATVNTDDDMTRSAPDIIHDRIQQLRKDPYTSLKMAETDVIEAIRKCAGVDPLSEEMRKVFFG